MNYREIDTKQSNLRNVTNASEVLFKRPCGHAGYLAAQDEFIDIGTVF